MVDDKGNKLCSSYEIEYYNINTNIKKSATIFIIINSLMIHNLTNEAISQYFDDAIYHCVLPTIRKYKLFIISGFHFKEMKHKYVSFHLYQTKNLKHIQN